MMDLFWFFGLAYLLGLYRHVDNYEGSGARSSRGLPPRRRRLVGGNIDESVSVKDLKAI